MQKGSANLGYSLAVRISSGLLKACSMSVEMKGRWGGSRRDKCVGAGEGRACVPGKGPAGPGGWQGRAGGRWCRGSSLLLSALHFL